ncbi:hypothetical protein ADH76_29415 [Enterocloster clostridioformis]|nr:hypothetical protein A4V08_04825 [Lachnoclostridium sp. YL32]OXE63465.1 hypothetical protein ADH76_29415 [Enterocloster clostridioformis]
MGITCPSCVFPVSFLCDSKYEFDVISAAERAGRNKIPKLYLRMQQIAGIPELSSRSKFTLAKKETRVKTQCH